MRIGVFALQGAFLEHEVALRKLGAETVEVRGKSDYKGLDGVILPGGESTVQGKLLREEGLFEPLRADIAGGMPVFGTCAGMILLAKQLTNDESVHLATMDVSVRRNAYGRQLGSFRYEGEMQGVGKIPMVFIRAPYVESVLPQGARKKGKTSAVEILAEVEGKIVAVQQGNMLATAFHPELTEDLRVHQYFLNLIK